MNLLASQRTSILTFIMIILPCSLLESCSEHDFQPLGGYKILYPHPRALESIAVTLIKKLTPYIKKNSRHLIISGLFNNFRKSGCEIHYLQKIQKRKDRLLPVNVLATTQFSFKKETAVKNPIIHHLLQSDSVKEFVVCTQNRPRLPWKRLKQACLTLDSHALTLFFAKNPQLIPEKTLFIMVNISDYYFQNLYFEDKQNPMVFSHHRDYSISGSLMIINHKAEIVALEEIHGQSEDKMIFNDLKSYIHSEWLATLFGIRLLNDRDLLERHSYLNGDDTSSYINNKHQ